MGVRRRSAIAWAKSGPFSDAGLSTHASPRSKAFLRLTRPTYRCLRRYFLQCCSTVSSSETRAAQACYLCFRQKQPLATDAQFIFSDLLFVTWGSKDFQTMLSTNNGIASGSALPVCAIHAHLLCIAFNCVTTVRQLLCVCRSTCASYRHRDCEPSKHGASNTPHWPFPQHAFPITFPQCLRWDRNRDLLITTTYSPSPIDKLTLDSDATPPQDS